MTTNINLLYLEMVIIGPLCLRSASRHTVIITQLVIVHWNRSDRTRGESLPSLVRPVPSRVLLELVEPWKSSFSAGVSQSA